MGPFFGVLEAGIEPARVLPHWILSPARLPIPPLERDRQFRESLQYFQPVRIAPAAAAIVISRAAFSLSS